jgi:hypothetical protein
MGLILSANTTQFISDLILPSGTTFSAGTTELLSPSGAFTMEDLRSSIDLQNKITSGDIRILSNSNEIVNVVDIGIDTMESFGGVMTQNIKLDGSFTATTLYGDGSNLSNIDNFYVTGGTYDTTATTLTLSRNNAINSINVPITPNFGVLSGTVLEGSIYAEIQANTAARHGHEDLIETIYNGISESISATTYTEVSGMTITGLDGNVLALFNSQCYIGPTITKSDFDTAVAKTDLALVISDIEALTQTHTHVIAFANETISPGVIDVAGAASFTGNIVLDGGGDPNAIFVIRALTTLTIATLANITLTNGAVVDNVHFLAGTTSTVAVGATVNANLISKAGAVAIAAGCTINGRSLTLAGAITCSGTLSAPTGTSLYIDYRSLETLVLYTGAGAITNAAASTYNGNIATNLGLLTAFHLATVNGTLYPVGITEVTNSYNPLVTFGLFVNNVLVPNSDRSDRGHISSETKFILQANVTVFTGDTISVKVKVDDGTVVTGNKVLSLFKDGVISTGDTPDTLQSVYNNSIIGEIITDASRGAVDIKSGSGSDSDNLLTLQGSSGDINAYVNGNGDALFNSISATTLYGDGSNLTLTPTEYFNAYDSAGGTTTNTTNIWVDIPLDTQRISGIDFSHTLNSAEITILNSGIYLIIGTCGTNAGSNQRTQSESRLVVDDGSGYTEVGGTKGEIYNRTTNYGGSSSFTAPLTLSSGDKIKMQFRRVFGVATIVLQPNTSTLTIANIRGTRGEQGAAGVSTGLTHDIQGLYVGTTTSTASATPVDLNGMSVTTNDLGGLATYQINFSASRSNSSGNRLNFFYINVGGVRVVQKRMYSHHANDINTIATTAIVSGVPYGTIIKIEYDSQGGGTHSVYERNININGILDANVV